jgi:DNA-binding CsgD family transcriptional regulator/tetratricopeptide (TPR) repeat protein
MMLDTGPWHVEAGRLVRFGHRADGAARPSAPTEVDLVRPASPSAAGGPRSSELLDREVPLAVLQAALERTRTGRGEVAIVTGEAGIGKTSLVRDFLTRLPAEIHAYAGVCDDLVTPRPLGPLHDIGRQVGGELGTLVRDGAPPEVVQHALLDLVGRLPPPPVLVLEDLHWADEATLDVVTFLGRRIAERPMLLVLTYRDVDVDARHPLTRALASLPPRRVTTQRLEPLTRHAVELLAAGGELDPTQLHAVTGGNPFYVTEVLAGAGAGLPATVAFAVTARVGRLPEPTRQLLQLLALVPSRVDTRVVAALQPDWQTVLGPAEANGMVELHDGALSFRHELARQAVAEQVPAIVASGWHARILEVLTSVGADPAVLVHHAERAGDHDAVARHAPIAARAAHAAEAHREAVAHYERALALEDRLEPRSAGELWLGLARARMAAERSEVEALDAARRGVALARALGDAPALGRALAVMSRIASWAGDNRLAGDLAGEAIDLLHPLGASSAYAQALAAAAYVALAQWEVQAAVSWAARAEAVADEVGDPRTGALARIFLGVADLSRSGDTTRLEEGIRAATDLGDRVAVVEGLMATATTFAFRRSYDRALEYADRALEFASAHEYTGWGVYVRTLRAQVFVETGRWTEARTDLAAVFATMMSARGWGRAAALAVRGRLGVRRGEPTARADLEEAWQLVRGSGVLQLCVPVVTALAELAWLDGALDGPPPELVEVAALPDVARWPAIAGELRLWLHRAGADPGDVETLARPHRLLIQGRYTEAAAAWEQLGCVYEAAEAAVLSDDEPAILAGIERLDGLGAAPLAQLARHRSRARGLRVPRGPQPATREHPAGLTPRQAEVLELLETGATNVQIADQLVLSVRTVDHHVAAILQRLGVTSRQDAARRARELASR